MRRLLIRMSFAAVGEGGGHRTRFIRLWRPTFCQSELHPHFQRPIKNPDLGRGLVLIARMHSDPQDTTPQMTRLVILVISCLRVCCISFTRRYIVPQLVTICNSILVRIELSCRSHRHTNRCQPMQDAHRFRDRGQNLVKPLVAIGRLIESTAAQFDPGAVNP